MKLGDYKFKGIISGMKYFVFSESVMKNYFWLISDNEDYIELICNDGIVRKFVWFGGLFWEVGGKKKFMMWCFVKIKN